MGVWNKICKKDLLINNNFKFEEDYIFEDQLFHIKTFFESKGMYINFEVQYYYRQTDISTVHTLDGNSFDIFRIMGLMEEFLKKKNIFEKYKYAFLQHKFQECNAMLHRIIAPLRKNFYMAAKQNLRETTKSGYNMAIIRKLISSNFYFDMILLSYEDYMRKYF